MSNDDEHPLWDEMRKAVAVPTADTSALVGASVVEAAVTAPATRAHILDGITSRINDPDVSLRKRAQLLRLQREYADAHNKLLSIGR